MPVPLLPPPWPGGPGAEPGNPPVSSGASLASRHGLRAARRRVLFIYVFTEWLAGLPAGSGRPSRAGGAAGDGRGRAGPTFLRPHPSDTRTGASWHSVGIKRCQRTVEKI